MSAAVVAEVIVTWTDHSVTVEWGGVAMLCFIAILVWIVRTFS